MLHEKTLLKFHWFRGATQQRSYFTFKRIQLEPTIYIHVFMGTILIWKINFKLYFCCAVWHTALGTILKIIRIIIDQNSKHQKLVFVHLFDSKLHTVDLLPTTKLLEINDKNLTRYLCMAVYSTRRDGQKFCGSNYTETATFLYVYSSI